jgi:DNA-3-methyladenine glycosylase I
MIRTRCEWAGSEPLYIEYHDREWGVPVHDDRLLFEFLVLEGAQAGLSWLTILRKRQHYRRAFEGFEPARVAAFPEAKIRALLADPGIVRNELKIRSAVRNAQAMLAVQAELGSFDRFLWQFVEGRPRSAGWKSVREVPARTPESDALSRELKRRGFTFVGTTICYALMQAVGLVNDHTVACFRYRQLAGDRGGDGAARHRRQRVGPSISIRPGGGSDRHVRPRPRVRG